MTLDVKCFMVRTLQKFNKTTCMPRCQYVMSRRAVFRSWRNDCIIVIIIIIEGFKVSLIIKLFLGPHNYRCRIWPIKRDMALRWCRMAVHRLASETGNTRLTTVVRQKDGTARCCEEAEPLSIGYISDTNELRRQVTWSSAVKWPVS